MSTVYPRFSSVFNSNVNISKTPSALEWAKWTGNVNYFNGKGGQLVPTSFVSGVLAANAQPYRYQMMLNPHPQITNRLWNLGYRTFGKEGDVTCTIQISGTTAVSDVILRDLDRGNTRHYNESIPDPYAQGTEQPSWMELTVGTDDGINLIIDHLNVVEVMRPQLDDKNDADFGTDPSAFDYRNAIFDGGGTHRGVGAFTRNLSSSNSQNRRIGQFGWFSPSHIDGTLDGTFAIKTTSTTYTQVVAPFRVQSRTIHIGDTQNILTAYFYVWVDFTTSVDVGIQVWEAGGADGEVVKTIAQNTGVWLSASIAVDCDDLTKETLNNSETLYVHAKTSAGTLNICSVQVCERG